MAEGFPQADRLQAVTGVIAEAFRVVIPGGRLQMADIPLEEGVTPEEVAQKGSWSDSIAGAVSAAVAPADACRSRFCRCENARLD